MDWHLSKEIEWKCERYKLIDSGGFLWLANYSFSDDFGQIFLDGIGARFKLIKFNEPANVENLFFLFHTRMSPAICKLCVLAVCNGNWFGVLLSKLELEKFFCEWVQRKSAISFWKMCHVAFIWCLGLQFQCHYNSLLNMRIRMCFSD